MGRMSSYVVSATVLTLMYAAFAGPSGGHGGGMPMGMPSGAMTGGAIHPGGMSSPGRASTDWTKPGGNSHAPTAPTNASHANPQAVLDRNSRLDAQLQKLLPAGTTPQQACAGFSDLGGCISALHVADNLDIPFDDLKSRMTGNDPSSLGAAIHTLRPDADVGHAQREAEKQTQRDLALTAD